MIATIHGRRVSVSPWKLGMTLLILIAGLTTTFMALTHEGGPVGFFNLGPSVTEIAEATGLSDITDRQVAAGGMRDYMKGDTSESEASESMWTSVGPYFAILLGLLGAGLALFTAFKFFKDVKKAEPGNERMVEIADAVSDGAMAYLKRQRAVVIPALIATAFIIFFINLAGAHWWLSIFVLFGLIVGGGCSFATGWYGMKTATMASSRTAWACKEGGLNAGLQVAFKAGAVMGLSVVGLGLAFVTLSFLGMAGIVDAATDEVNLNDVANAMITFGLGASLVALFARVGGGIFTKAADVGADLVGKVEAGIPEDDPRNPATIADNVGDNVGDVAGMGADLYESYIGSILATIALSFSAAIAVGRNPWSFASAPIIIAAIGIVLAVACTKLVKTKDGASLAELLHSLHKGVNFASIGVGIAAIPVCLFFFGSMFWGMLLAIWIGLGAGLVIAWGSERYTAYDYKPTQDVAKSAQTGAATVIITGLAVGMMSTWIPIITVAVATLLAFGFAGGFASASVGLYGVALAAVSMLSTLGITLATDAYGPIADNAGGNAEMAKLPPEVRERTDALDSLGNTTAAIGKGFAIGSAALTALALIATYFDSIKSYIDAGSDVAFSFDALLITSPSVIIGLFIGAMLVFIFGALTMTAVGDAAKEMVEEVRRQFREIPGILEGTGKPDYQSCVDISTSAALRKMVLPSVLAVAGPIVTGVLFGAGAVFGLLAGGLAAGFALAVMMANAGGAWDNAKKWVEKGGLAQALVDDGVYNPEVEDAALAPVSEDQGGPDSDDKPAKKKSTKKKTSTKKKSSSSKKKATSASSKKKKATSASSKKKKAAADEEDTTEEETPAEEPVNETKDEPAEEPKAEESKDETESKEEAKPVAVAVASDAGSEAEDKPQYRKYGKGSDAHKATVVGDTVGDPFKDTSGPSLNILIKLMSMVAVATVALTMLINDGNGLLPWIFELISTKG